MIYRQPERRLAVTPPQVEGALGYSKLEIVPQQDLCGAGRLLSQITLPPGGAIPEHGHQEEYEVYCILTGEGDYLDNGVVVKVRAGDVALCPSGQRHSLTNTGSDNLVFVAFIGFPNSEKQ